MTDLLAIGIKRGDEQAFELFFRKYYTRLSSFAYRYVDDIEDVKDIVADLFLKLWESREKINPDDSLGAYLFTAAKHQCLNYIRHKALESKYFEVYQTAYSSVLDEESLSYPNELSEVVQKTCESLPLRCREVFEYSRFDGLKYVEIADKMGISVKTVEAHMKKALAIFREKMKDYYVLFL